MGAEVIASAPGVPPNGAYPTADTSALSTRVAGDPGPRFDLDANGDHEWSATGGAIDTTLARTGAGLLNLYGTTPGDSLGTLRVTTVQDDGGALRFSVTGFIRANFDPTNGQLIENYGFQTKVITSGTLPAITFVSGTGQQVSTFRDATVYVPVTFNPLAAAAATCLIELSPDNVTYTAVGTETVPAGTALAGFVRVLSLFVPGGAYVRLTVTNATIAAGRSY